MLEFGQKFTKQIWFQNHLQNISKSSAIALFILFIQENQAWIERPLGFMPKFVTVAHCKNLEKIWIQIEFEFIWKSFQKIKTELEKE